MATFTGSGADDIFTGSEGDDTFFSGGGKDSISGAGGNDRLVINAVLAAGANLDGGTGSDTLVFASRPDAKVIASPDFAEGVARSLYSLQAITVASIERVEFASNANTQVSALTFWGNQFGGGAIAENATVIGGDGSDALVVYVESAGSDGVFNAPRLTYTNWETPERAFMGGDMVSFSVSGSVKTINGSPHAGVQALTGSASANTINGSDDMDRISGGGGVDALFGNGGDDAFVWYTTVTDIFDAGGSRVSQHITGAYAQGEIDGGTGFDFLVFGGNTGFGAIAHNIEGMYLAPEYSNAIIPGQPVQSQTYTIVNIHREVLEKFPGNLLIDGVGRVSIDYGAGGFDGSGYTFAPGSSIEFQVDSGGSGNDSDDVIIGTTVNDGIDTSRGNDVITPGGGDDWVNGGAGFDVVALSGDHSEYTVTRDVDGALNFSGPDGEDRFYQVEAFRFDDGDFIWKAGEGFQAVPAAATGAPFRVFLAPGFTGGVGGVGSVIGTVAPDEITIIGDGSAVTLDSSFNRGDDIIHLPGFANEYAAKRSGSNIVLTNEFTTISIPVGTSASYLAFGDDAAGQGRKVFYSTEGALHVGEQFFYTSLERLAPPTQPVSLPVQTGANPDAVSRIFLGVDGSATLDGNFSVIGANGSEQVLWLSGNLTLDNSFNGGGDILRVDDVAQNLSAHRSGSNVVLTWDGHSAVVPVGVSGMYLNLGSSGDTVDSRKIYYDAVSKAVHIGDQVISAFSEATAVQLYADPVPITPAHDSNFAAIG